MKALVTGAGGFIGGHLADYLKNVHGYEVFGVDIKPPEFRSIDEFDGFLLADLRDPLQCVKVATMKGIEEIYHLAADMGGIGYITKNHAAISRNNNLIDLHMLDIAREVGASRFFYASSACVYPAGLQDGAGVDEPIRAPGAWGLKESDAIPAEPEEGYGWEKLWTEKLCQYYAADFGLQTRVARFHNCYGPLGTYDGGKEKAPAALCRKVALAKNDTSIDIWGDGNQTRSFIFIDDLVEGIFRLMQSSHSAPMNLGTEEMISINELAAKIIAHSAKRLTINHVEGPQGVRARNSDNTMMREVLGWEPKVSLDDGLRTTYWWIANIFEMAKTKAN